MTTSNIISAIVLNLTSGGGPRFRFRKGDGKPKLRYVLRRDHDDDSDIEKEVTAALDKLADDGFTAVCVNKKWYRLTLGNLGLCKADGETDEEVMGKPDAGISVEVMDDSSVPVIVDDPTAPVTAELSEHSEAEAVVAKAFADEQKQTTQQKDIDTVLDNPAEGIREAVKQAALDYETTPNFISIATCSKLDDSRRSSLKDLSVEVRSASARKTEGDYVYRMLGHLGDVELALSGLDYKVLSNRTQEQAAADKAAAARDAKAAKAAKANAKAKKAKAAKAAKARKAKERAAARKAAGKETYEITVTESRCTKCGETKPASEFHRDRARKGGLGCWCHACDKAHLAKKDAEKAAAAKAEA